MSVEHKKSVYTCYNGDNRSTRMISDAVNNIADDVLHDSVVVTQKGIGQDVIDVTGDRYGDLGVEESLYGIDFYRSALGKFKKPEIPQLNWNGILKKHYDNPERDYIQIDCIPGYSNPDYARTCASYELYGLKKGCTYTLSFTVRVRHGQTEYNFEDYIDTDPTKMFGIVISDNYTIDDYELGVGYVPIIPCPQNQVFEHWYSDIQYYSLPRSHNIQNNNVEFTFIASEEEMWMHLVLEAFDQTYTYLYLTGIDGLIDLVDIRLNDEMFIDYNSEISRIVATDKYGIKALFNTNKLSYYGTSYPNSSYGEDGAYYVRYGSSINKTPTLSCSEYSGFSNPPTIVNEGNSGIWSVSESCREPSSSQISTFDGSYKIKISNLTVGHAYHLSFDRDYTEINGSVSLFYIKSFDGAYKEDEGDYGGYDASLEIFFVAPKTEMNMEVIFQATSSNYTYDIGMHFDNFKFTEYSILDVWYKIEGGWTKLEVSGGGGGGASVLSDLLDVNISNPITNGQALVYDSANSVWINKTNSVAYYGTSDPSSNQGLNGDIYMKYVAGLGVSRIFGKISNTWMAFNNYLEFEWDFTKSLNAVNNGAAITLDGGASRSASGISFSEGDNKADIPPQLLQKGYTYEITIASMSITTTSSNNRVFMYTSNNAYNSGFYWQGTSGKWTVYDPSGAIRSEIDDPSFFNNSVLKIVIDNDGYWHIYKDNVVVFEPNRALVLQNTAFALGASSNACYNMTISRFRIYPNIV